MFMDSEIEIDDSLKKISNITAYPEYLNLLSASSAIPNLILLLQHENLDI